MKQVRTDRLLHEPPETRGDCSSAALVQLLTACAAVPHAAGDASSCSRVSSPLKLEHGQNPPGSKCDAPARLRGLHACDII